LTPSWAVVVNVLIRGSLNVSFGAINVSSETFADIAAVCLNGLTRKKRVHFLSPEFNY
jgi:hypothetical protein